MAKFAKCSECTWQLIYTNGPIGCLQSTSLHDEIPKIKEALSTGKCDDFRAKKQETSQLTIDKRISL